jgi:hypothetical protein
MMDLNSDLVAEQVLAWLAGPRREVTGAHA